MLTVVILLSTLFSGTSVFASEITSASNDELRKQYEELQKQGALGTDITYEIWLDAITPTEEPKSELVEQLKESGQIGLAQTMTPGYVMKRGDIFVTTSTNAPGLYGHAAIAVSGTYILNIRGPGYTTELLTLSQWKSSYNKSGSYTWIYRPNDATVASEAGLWAYNNYYNPTGGATQTIKPEYSITLNTFSTDPTYCSKIVYQAYHAAAEKLGKNFVYNYWGQIVKPYDLRGAAFLQTPPEVAVIAN